MFPDIPIPFFFAGIDEWVKLDDATALFKDFQIGAVVCLPPHETGSPDLIVLLECLQRFHFIDGTAKVRICLPGLVLDGKPVFPVFRSDIHHIQLIQLGQLLLVFQGFREVKAGIDKEDLLRGTYPGKKVQKKCRCGGK